MSLVSFACCLHREPFSFQGIFFSSNGLSKNDYVEITIRMLLEPYWSICVCLWFSDWNVDGETQSSMLMVNDWKTMIYFRWLCDTSLHWAVLVFCTIPQLFLLSDRLYWVLFGCGHWNGKCRVQSMDSDDCRGTVSLRGTGWLGKHTVCLQGVYLFIWQL